MGVVRFPPWAVLLKFFIAVYRGWCLDMIIVIFIMSISLTLILWLLISKALSNDANTCEFSCEFNIKGFKIHFKTKEKNVPSDK